MCNFPLAAASFNFAIYHSPIKCSDCQKKRMRTQQDELIANNFLFSSLESWNEFCEFCLNQMWLFFLLYKKTTNAHHHKISSRSDRKSHKKVDRTSNLKEKNERILRYATTIGRWSRAYNIKTVPIFIFPMRNTTALVQLDVELSSLTLEWKNENVRNTIKKKQFLLLLLFF